MVAGMDQTFDNMGFEIVRDVFGQQEVEDLIQAFDSHSTQCQRALLANPTIRKLAHSDPLMRLLRPHLSQEPRAVRSILFDKSPDANWFVTWHQDLTIAVQEKLETPGFESWNLKAGIHHVQPPTHVLEQMVTVRIHLDDTDETNGALKVLQGSHRHGKLSPDLIQIHVQITPAVHCSAAAGDVLLMRPLILHASGKSKNQSHRRILHIEYAGLDLPHGLKWHKAA